jgi:hypothetical protein
VEDLLRRVGVPAARINSDELTGVDLLIDAGRRVVRLNGRTLLPTVSWSRHFSALAIEASAAPARDLFLRDSWQALAGQLGALAGLSIQGRRPGLLEQLSLADRHQIAVPMTVITADPRQAKQALRGSLVVIKALHQHFVEGTPGRLTGVFPTVVERRSLTGMPQLGPPVVIQEFIEHDAELRVYYVQGQVLGFDVSKATAAELWLAVGRVTVRQVDLPLAVVRATRVLASALSLRYGAFDFLMRAGAPVFLEVNPDGDWRWIEAKTRTAPVTLAVARMLCDLHRDLLPALAAPLSHSSGAFDLMTFLSARQGRPDQLSADAGRPFGSLAS